jgi:hypothetical protein
MRSEEFRRMKSFITSNINQLARILAENDLKANLTTEAKIKFEDDIRNLKENREELLKIYTQEKLELIHSQALAIKNDIVTLRKKSATTTPIVYSLYNLKSMGNLKKGKKKKINENNYDLK